ncbi:predicted protein, partial [Nematostella vectensis]
IGDLGAQRISNGLALNTKVTELILVDAGIGPSGTQALAKAIQNVTLLDMSINPIGLAGLNAIANILQDNSCRLKTLILDGCGINMFGARSISKALSKNTSLEKLSLACNNIDDEGMCALAKYVTKTKSLQSLDISYNHISDVGKKAIIDACSENNSTLSTFHIHSPSIDDNCAIALAEVLSGNTTLTDIYIGGEILGDAGVQYIAEALKFNTTIRTLAINPGRVTPDAGQAFGEMLRHNNTITRLTSIHSHGNIVDLGAQRISDGLALNTKVTELTLVNAGIGPSGTRALAKAIQNVTLLDMSANPIGLEGLNAIANILQDNSCRLKSLILDGCCINMDGARSISKALSKNTSLEKLSLACNNIGD